MPKTLLLRVQCLLLSALFFFSFLLSEGAADPTSRLARRSPDEQQTIDIYKSTSPGVVFILTTTLTVDPDEFFPEVRPQEGSGSGIVVDADQGIILTNLHVIADASKVDIFLSDGKNYSARIVARDEETDLAVLQFRNKPEFLSAIPFGDSSKLEVGQRVLAIGNPFGLNRTLTSGIISSLDRNVKSPRGTMLRGLIQTDAAINPGNSGGPLLDMEGRLIGINSAILSSSGDSAGIGFAVPINQVKRILPELLATGRVLRPKIGWLLIDTDQGPMVKQVIPQGPADRSGVAGALRIVSVGGLRSYVLDYAKADLILSMNGKPVHNRDEVDELVSQAEPGQPLVFSMKRGGIDGPERRVSIQPVLR